MTPIQLALLIFGVMLFLMAAGLTLVFGIMNLINLAHGSLYMAGAFFVALFTRLTGNFWVGVALALPATAICGLILEKLVLPLLGQAPGADDEASLEIAAGDQLLHQEARHDRLSGSGVVGQQEPERLPGQHLFVDGRDHVDPNRSTVHPEVRVRESGDASPELPADGFGLGRGNFRGTLHHEAWRKTVEQGFRRIRDLPDGRRRHDEKHCQRHKVHDCDRVADKPR